MTNRYFIRNLKNWEFMEISEEEAQKQVFVEWLEDMPGEWWAVRGYYREEAFCPEGEVIIERA